MKYLALYLVYLINYVFLFSQEIDNFMRKFEVLDWLECMTAIYKVREITKLDLKFIVLSIEYLKPIIQ